MVNTEFEPDRLEHHNPAELRTSPFHRRRYWGDMEGLAESIRAVGVIEPLIVRMLEDGSHEIVAGERRRKASVMAALATVPVIVREYTDEAAILVQGAENLQRADLHPMDEAEIYEMLRGRGISEARIAAEYGKTAAHVRERLKLCTLAPAVRDLYLDGKLSHTVAYGLARLPDHDVQVKAAEAVMERMAATPDRASDDELGRLVYELRGRYMLRLAQAPFPLDDPGLPPRACAGCPDRSDSQVELFPELDAARDAYCLRPACHQGKVEAFWQREAAAAREAGREVIDGEAAADLFMSSGSTTLSHEGYDKYVKADDAAIWGDRGKKTTYAQAIEAVGAEVAPILVKGPNSEPITLFPRKVAQKVAKKVRKEREREKADARSNTSAHEVEDAAMAEARRKREERERVVEATAQAIGRAARDAAVLPSTFWLTLTRFIGSTGTVGMGPAAAHRGCSVAELEEQIGLQRYNNDELCTPTMGTDDARALAAELLAYEIDQSWQDDRNEELDALAAAFGIDPATGEPAAVPAKAVKASAKAAAKTSGKAAPSKPAKTKAVTAKAAQSKSGSKARSATKAAPAGKTAAAKAKATAPAMKSKPGKAGKPGKPGKPGKKKR